MTIETLEERQKRLAQADEFNISASMEPVTPIDAAAQSNDEWPDIQRLFELAPVGATHVYGDRYRKHENGEWYLVCWRLAASGNADAS